MYLPDLFATIPEDRAERWRRLAAFIEGWWGPVQPEDGFPEEELRGAEAVLGVALPAAVREAYARFGQRDELVVSFDHLVLPHRFELHDGVRGLWTRDDFCVWGIREADLALADPPVILREKSGRQWHTLPALPEDPSVSRFFLWKALEQAIYGSRYANSVNLQGDLNPLAAEVARHFPRLGFGQVEHPAPASRLYGGEDVLIDVAQGDGIKIVASTEEGYRRAMDVLRPLSLAWQLGSAAEAHRGSFHEVREGLIELDLVLAMVGRASRLPASPRPAPPRVEDRATASAGDLDPRLGACVERALHPYVMLLPRAIAEAMRATLEAAIAIHAPLEMHAAALVGRPIADDDIAPPMPALRPEVEAVRARLPPEMRDQVDAVIRSGVVEKLLGARVRWRARLDAALLPPGAKPSDDEQLDFALAWAGDEAVSRFLTSEPDGAVDDQTGHESQLVRILRPLAAAMFAGITGALFVWLEREGSITTALRYTRAILAARKLRVRRRDDKAFYRHYQRRESADEVAARLGLPVAVAHERHRAFLEHAAAVLEAVADRLEQAGRGPYRAGESMGGVYRLLTPGR